MSRRVKDTDSPPAFVGNPSVMVNNGVPRICYHACEELYHQLGGKKAGLTLMHITHEGFSHYYLRWETPQHTLYLDPTAGQFDTLPPYTKGRGRGFLTKERCKTTKLLFDV